MIPVSRRALIFTAVVGSIFLSSVDSTIVATALSSLRSDLNVDYRWIGWVITSYSLGLVAGLPVIGPISDRLGRRQTFEFCLGLFGVSSIICALTSNIGILVLARFFQALGGAGFTPTATGIAIETFGRGRDKLIGLFGGVFAIGAIVGPVIGGLIVESFSWRIIFAINVPIIVILIIMSHYFIPKLSLPSDRPALRSFDWASPFWLSFAILSTMLLAAVVSQSTYLARTIACFCGFSALLSFRLFWRHVKSRSSSIPLFIVRGRGFGSLNIINFCYGGFTNGILVLLPLYSNVRYGFGARDSANLLALTGLSTLVLTFASITFLRAIRYRIIIFVGALVICLGVGGLSITSPSVASYGWLSLASVIIGIGKGILSPASRNAGLQLAPDFGGSIAALRTMGIELGMIFVVSINTALGGDNGPADGRLSLIFISVAVVMVGFFPFIFRVPDQKGAW